MIAYVQNAPATFNLTADNILYLKDVGLSPAVISAMLTHDNNLRSQPHTATPPYQPLQTNPNPTPATEPVPTQEPPQTAAAPTYVNNPPPDVNYFYSDLSPYGTWVDVENVGWCWQPRVVVINHGWRPYCDGGHWVYSDCGWYWQSDYSWGWATFHYGRWQLHPRCGWVWAPDRVWGPAWVTWRSGGDNCGWAPLPPHAYFDAHAGYVYNGIHVGVGFDFGLSVGCFTFVAVHDFNSHDFAHHCVPVTQVKNVYNHTTVINNYTVVNNTVVNHGIPVEHVAAATHTEFKKAVVREVPAGAPAVAGRAAVADKSTPVVYRHELKATPPKPVNVVAQKVDDRHPVVQHAPIVATRPAARPGTTPTLQSRNQPGTIKTAPQQASDRAASPRPTIEKAPSPASRTYQPPQPTRPSASAAPLEHAEEPKETQRTQPGTTRYGTTASQPYSKQTPAQSHPTEQTENQKQSPQIYYPKTYHQSADVRSLPRSEPRAAAPARVPQDSGSKQQQQQQQQKP
jgi:hypothetical protein